MFSWWACALNKDSNQPVHPRSMIRVLIARMKLFCIIGYQKMCSEVSDQTAWMHKLIRSKSSQGVHISGYIFWLFGSFLVRVGSTFWFVVWRCGSFPVWFVVWRCGSFLVEFVFSHCGSFMVWYVVDWFSNVSKYRRIEKSSWTRLGMLFDVAAHF